MQMRASWVEILSAEYWISLSAANLPAIGNAMYAGSDQVFMYSGSEVPQQEYRSYVDDEDSDEYLAPDPFALPVPTPPEQEDK